MEKPPLFEGHNITVGYRDSPPIFRDLSFSIPPGEVTVILGRSGCGKSTLLKALLGLLPLRKGRLFFQGEEMNRFTEPQWDAHYRRIGVLYQNGALLNSLSLAENVALPLKIHSPHLPRPIGESVVATRLFQVGLQGSEEKLPGELSGGMKKRAALARALVLDPEVLLCDEPSAGLDPLTARGLDDLILDLKNRLGASFVVVTHEVSSIRRIADRILALEEGRLLFQGSLQEGEKSHHPFLKAFFAQGAQDDQ